MSGCSATRSEDADPGLNAPRAAHSARQHPIGGCPAGSEQVSAFFIAEVGYALL